MPKKKKYDKDVFNHSAAHVFAHALLRLYKDAKIACDNLVIAGIRGWRVATVQGLNRMETVYRNQEPHPFTNLQRTYIRKGKGEYSCFQFTRKGDWCDYDQKGAVWCVRGGN